MPILALTIAYKIVTGTIDVTKLLSDGNDGAASTSRFQLVVFFRHRFQLPGSS